MYPSLHNEEAFREETPILPKPQAGEDCHECGKEGKRRCQDCLGARAERALDQAWEANTARGGI